ncbi:Degradation activator [Raoultella terrigena]|nr:Degradation activator [Raoultella terrigena]
MTTVTLAQVAERAGVSTATVSMVLRNRGRISQATRERVLKALDDAAMSTIRPPPICATAAAIRSGCCCTILPTPFYGEMTAG